MYEIKPVQPGFLVSAQAGCGKGDTLLPEPCTQKVNDQKDSARQCSLYANPVATCMA